MTAGADKGGARSSQVGGQGEGSVSGAGGDGQAGAGEGATAGEGKGPERPTTVIPELYGQVRLLVAGEAVCGGTLIANSWVLTADHCIPEGTPPSSVVVRFGRHSTRFDQQRSGLEVQRFPGNTGSEAGRVRDLLLLGLDSPFEINGSTTKHYVPLWMFGGFNLVGTHRCFGWDLKPDPNSSTDELRSEPLVTLAIAQDTGVEKIWWVNSDLSDPLHGTLPTPADAGSGCFTHRGHLAFLTSVQSETPLLRRDGATNSSEEAIAVSVSVLEVHNWLDRVLFERLPLTAWELGGSAAVCSFGRTSLELFSRKPDGRMGWWRQTGWPSAAPDAENWQEQPSIPEPEAPRLGVHGADVGGQGGVPLSVSRPGVFCAPDGSIELFARADDDSLWWQRWRPQEAAWAEDWEHVNGRATSGISVVGSAAGHFHVFARGELGELRHSEYDGDWVRSWDDLEGHIFGAPAARLATDEWIDVWALGPNNSHYNRYFHFGAEGWQYMRDSISEPAVASWSADRTDTFHRTAGSVLERQWLDVVWSEYRNDTGLVLPAGEITAVSREPGSVDVFVSRPGAPLWHAVWPRDPRP